MIVTKEDTRYDSDEYCICNHMIHTDGAFELHTCPECGADIYPCNNCKDQLRQCRSACPLDTNVKIVGKFDGGYTREGVITRRVAKCCVCEEERDCIGMDNSEEEYKTGYICFGCIEMEKNHG
jgi:predicted RNA-binding Zn-ribbon protein involved in translation (DUF1610 family)